MVTANGSRYYRPQLSLVQQYRKSFLFKLDTGCGYVSIVKKFELTFIAPWSHSKWLNFKRARLVIHS